MSSLDSVDPCGPVRTKTRSAVLFWLATITGVLMYAVYQYMVFAGVLPNPLPNGDSVGVVSLGVDLALGGLALAMLPAAIHHDPMERQESYIGPPSALVASLVVLCLWMVSVLAAPAGAVVLISLSARLSASWTVPAVAASMLSIFVHELTYDPKSGLNWSTVIGALLLTLLLVLMGGVRGMVLRRQERAYRLRTQTHQPAATQAQAH